MSKMPTKRRTTRNLPSKKRESAVLKDMSPEELKRREGIDLMLKDFDKQVDARIAEMEADMESTIKSIHTLYKVELIKLPSSIKNMKWTDYVSQCREDGSYPLALTSAMEKVVEDVTSTVDPKLSTIKTTKKPSTKSKRASRSSKASSDLATPAPSSSRIARSKKGSSSLATPSGAPPPAMGRTPFITPRFNTATPLSRTVSRVARPNETLVSLSGSPVVPLALKSKAAKAEAEGNALIPLGKGQTLNVPMNPDLADQEGYELDDDAREKIAAIHASLGNLLKIREKTSVSSDEY